MKKDVPKKEEKGMVQTHAGAKQRQKGRYTNTSKIGGKKERT